MNQFLYEMFVTGFSGWIFVLVTAIFGSGRYVFMRRQKTTQRNIMAGGDVAGGDINTNSKQSDAKSKNGAGTSIQVNINAKGSVAGGDINRDKP